MRMSSVLAGACSVFFISGTNEKLLGAGLDSDAHVVAVDLEDMVPDSDKANARAIVKRTFSKEARGPLRMVRINAVDTAYLEDDLALIASIQLDGILLPKATPSALQSIEKLDLPVLALIESGDGLRQAYEMAMMKQVEALFLAPSDFTKDLRILRDDGDVPLLYARSKIVADSAAAGVRAPVDYPSRKSGKEFEEECRFARRLGYGGKFCINVDQLAVVNEVFSS
jgi:citrate lyase subunit beta/citryl-CoA lyase